MAYARFGWGGSDVYVYLNVGGYLCCCACLLGEREEGALFSKSKQCYSTSDMIEHLDEHREAGHTVPQSCIDSLKEDAEENDNWIAKHKPEIDDELRNAYNNRVPFFRDVDGRFTGGFWGYKGATGGQTFVFNKRELPKRIQFGDRTSFYHWDTIKFDNLASYCSGYIAVVNRIKSAIKARNEHYGQTEEYISVVNSLNEIYKGRVAVISHATEDKVYLVGYGEYVDDGVSLPVIQATQALKYDEYKYGLLADQSPLFNNPRIVLESGEEVWGYECHWVPLKYEEGQKEFDAWVDGREVVHVSLEEMRKEQKLIE